MNALLEPALHPGPLFRAHNPRNQIEWKNALRPSGISVDVEGDAHLQQQPLSRLLAPDQLSVFQRFDRVQQQPRFRSHDAVAVEHLILESLGLIRTEPHSGPPFSRCAVNVARTEQGPSVLWDWSLYYNERRIAMRTPTVQIDTLPTNALPMKVIIAAALLFLGSKELLAQSVLAKFMGHAITIAKSKADAEGFAADPASVCVEFVPQRQCYTAPNDYRNHPTATVVQVQKDTPALFFSAESYGVSGWQIHFALLRPGTGKNLEDIFRSDTSVSNQSQHEFWTDPSISDAQFFVTADYVWGPDECHTCTHRYIISTYARKPSSCADGLFYYLEDRYMTIRKYNLYAKANVLASERQEILARLGRIKAENPQ